MSPAKKRSDKNPPWVVERIRKDHDRRSFSCGNDELDEYLRRYARQNDKKGIGYTYVVCREGKKLVSGYFTISTSSIEFEDLPATLAKGLPRYPVPCVSIWRLAVDRESQGKGLGRLLLMEAFQCALSAGRSAAVYAIVVDAKDDKARAFHLKHGFDSLKDDRFHLLVSLKAIRELFGN